MWTLILSIAGNFLLGLVGKLFGSAQEKKAGMDAQKAADDAATVAAATAAARAGSEVAGESDDQVVEDLKNDFRN